MEKIARLIALLQKHDVDFSEDTGSERPVINIGFVGANGLVLLSFSENDNSLTLQEGMLSTHETHLLRGYCSQERYEFNC